MDWNLVANVIHPDKEVVQMEYTIDRFEGEYVVCEDKNGVMYEIQKDKIPSEAQEGSKIKKMEERYSIVENQNDKARIKSKMDKLFK